MIKTSKFISFVLRHKPEVIGITLSKSGWVNVNTLLEQLNKHKNPITLTELYDIVNTNNKKRFEFSDDKTQIRATQGHTVKVDLDLPVSIPPDILYHGSVEKYMKSINENGLTKQKRHAVHLSSEISTAVDVAKRRGVPVLLIVDSKQMVKDGYKFYLTKNNVWLTDNIPTKYITIK